MVSAVGENVDAGEVLQDLEIIEHRSTKPQKENISFAKTKTKGNSTFQNFRKKDAVVLYEQNRQDDNATNKMVFKGNIEEMNTNTIKVRLRATQQNIAVLPSDSLYAIEHDAMATSFRAMYQGLWAVMTAHKERREFLLNIRAPQ